MLVLVLAGCGGETQDVLLENPPFETLTDSIQKDPKNAQLYYNRAVLLFRNNYTAYARQDVEKAWELQPKEEYALSLANLLNKKSPDSAILFLEKATEKVKGSVALLVALAKNYQQTQNLKKAIAICDVILQQYPNQLDALLLKAELVTAGGNEKEATLLLEKAYQYAPSDVDLVYQLAQKYAEAKNDKALNLSDSLIKADVEGRHAEPYLLKGMYYQAIQNYPLALQQFNTAITKDYNNLDGHMYKGQVYFEMKNYTDAYKAFQLAATITPSYADAYYWMAKCQEAAGNKNEAKTNYQRAFELDEELVEAKEAAERMK